MSKGGDPFNFNDIYAQMGADNLVKKPMSEIKRPAAAPSRPAKAHSPPSLEKAQDCSKAYDLDFLGFGGASKTAASPAPAPGAPRTATPTGVVSSATPTSPANSLGFNELFTTAPSNTPSLTSKRESTHAADPFAAFESVDGAMPVVKSAPISGAATPDASSANLISLAGDSTAGFHGMYCPASGPAGPELQPAAGAPPTQAAAPLQPYPAIPEAAASSPASSGYKPSRQPPPPPASSFRPSTAAVHDSHQMDRRSNAVDISPSPQPPRTSLDGGYSSHRDQPSTRPGVESSPSSSHNMHDKSARGITGFFSDLRKKAVKAAQVGLQHLESAMEGKEQGAAGKGWGSGHLAGSDSGEVLVTRPAVMYEAAAWAEPDDVGGAAKALEVAVRIAELPVEVRGDALAQLRPGLRSMVEEILREQVLLETEDRDEGADSQQHTYQSVALSMDGAAHEQQVQKVPEVADLLASDDVLTSNRRHPGSINPPSSAHDVAGMDDFFSGAGTPPPGSTAPGEQARPGTGEAAVKGAAPAAAQPHQLFGSFVSGAEELGAGHAQPARPAPGPNLGFGSFMSPPSSQLPAAAARPVPQQEAGDMGDFFRGGQTSAAAAAPTSKPESASFMPPPTGQPPAAAARPALQQEAGDMGDFFRGGQTSVAPAAPTSKPASAMPPTHMDLIGDLHSEGVDVSSHQQLYEDVDTHEGEPEIRRQLRAARLAERNGKMRAALAEKLAQDDEEARRKEEQVQLKDQHKQMIDAWKSKHKTNIRGLLGSLHTVLWENSGWTVVSVGDLLESSQVKKVYMKANLLVHPDKVRQRNGTAEQVAVADMVFDVLKEAWNAFKP